MPQLLDWLAEQLIAGGWRLKPLHKQIVMSAAYRQQVSVRRPNWPTSIAEARFYFRRPRRLEAEALRDAILAVSGRLDLTMFGPPVKAFIPAGGRAGRDKDNLVAARGRRAGTMAAERLFVRQAFGCRCRGCRLSTRRRRVSSCGRRTQSIVPTQALALLNDGFVRRQAQRVCRARGDRRRRSTAAKIESGLSLGAWPVCPAAAERAGGHRLFCRPAGRHGAGEFLPRAADDSTSFVTSIDRDRGTSPRNDDRSDNSSAPTARCPRRLTRYANRREFLRRVGGGLGTLGLGRSVGPKRLVGRRRSRPEESAGSAGRPFSGPGQKRHLAVHGRGAERLRSVRSEAGTQPNASGERVDNIETHFGNPGPLLASPFSFQQYGQSGAWVCDRYPTLAQHVDDIAFIKSVHTESPNHAPAMYQMNTGLTRPGFPSAAHGSPTAWEARTRTFPASSSCRRMSAKGDRTIGASGFLPGSFQATLLRTSGQPILNLDRPADVSPGDQRAMLDLAAQLNGEHLGPPSRRGRLAGPDRLVRIGLSHAGGRSGGHAIWPKSRQQIHQLYGLDRGGRRRPSSAPSACWPGGWSNGACASSRSIRNDEWDAHGDIADNHGRRCAETDVPIAGLLDRSEAARAAGFDAGHLGRRIRPHAGQPKRAKAATTTRTAF